MAAPTLVQQANAQGTDAGSVSPLATLAAKATAGNLLVTLSARRANATAASTPPAGFTLVLHDGTPDLNVAWKVATGTEQAVQWNTGSATDSAVWTWISEWSLPSAIVGASSQQDANAGGDPMTCPTLAPTAGLAAVVLMLFDMATDTGSFDPPSFPPAAPWVDISLGATHFSGSPLWPTIKIAYQATAADSGNYPISWSLGGNPRAYSGIAVAFVASPPRPGKLVGWPQTW